MGRHGWFKKFWIGPWLSNRIKSERPIRIESNFEASQVPTMYCLYLRLSFTGVFAWSRSCSTVRVCATCSYQTTSCWRFLQWLDLWDTWSSLISVVTVSCPHMHNYICMSSFVYSLPVQCPGTRTTAMVMVLLQISRLHVCFCEIVCLIHFKRKTVAVRLWLWFCCSRNFANLSCIFCDHV